MGDAGMWVLLGISVVCFGALIATNRPGAASDDDASGPHGGGGGTDDK